MKNNTCAILIAKRIGFTLFECRRENAYNLEEFFVLVFEASLSLFDKKTAF